ncbi:hypothetical protein CA235_07285 [Sphingomonas sp. ABOLF]|uniref:hypothetical protein n=1 Tax=Sphingomonas sp. ABOLF TaxID=1985879 RepID=UPI000F7D8EF2|nr:hypothetical protein [Sphingomonas sp. ABOLF]RSV15649.1 hypothetical protein CA235_07285 [Sphingomonas sp. ABOLF]
MTGAHITTHAAVRWCERIDNRATLIQAVSAIRQHMPAIERALAFGAPVVRLSNGAKLLLRDGAVITVYPRAWIMPPRGRC